MSIIKTFSFTPKSLRILKKQSKETGEYESKLIRKYILYFDIYPEELKKLRDFHD